MSSKKDELVSYYDDTDGKIYVTTEFICKHYGVNRKTLTSWNKKGLISHKKHFSKSNLYVIQEVEQWREKNINKTKSKNSKKEIKIDIEEKTEETDEELWERYDKADVGEKRRILRSVGQNKLDELKKMEDFLEKEAKNKEYDERYALVDDVGKAQQELAALFMSFLKTSMPVLSKDLEMKKQDEIYHELDRYYGKEINSIVRFIGEEKEIVVTLHEVIMEIVKIVSEMEVPIENVMEALKGIE